MADLMRGCSPASAFEVTTPRAPRLAAPAARRAFRRLHFRSFAITVLLIGTGNRLGPTLGRGTPSRTPGHGGAGPGREALAVEVLLELLPVGLEGGLVGGDRG